MAFLQGLTPFANGILIIIVTLLAATVVFSFAIKGKYSRLIKDINDKENRKNRLFKHKFMNEIVVDYQSAVGNNIAEIKTLIESDSDNRISDIHVWRVGPHHLSAVISIVTHFPKSPGYYKNLLSAYDEINHVTVEVNKCEDDPCIIPHAQLI